MKAISIKDIPIESASSFSHENWASQCMHAGFIHFSTELGGWKVESWRNSKDKVTLIGWNALKGSHLMIGREEQIAVLAEIEEAPDPYEDEPPAVYYLWQHVPFFPEDFEDKRHLFYIKEE